MSVEQEHPLFTARSHQWRMIRDCIEGEEAIKRAGEKYLPRAAGASIEQYKRFQLRARFINYTGRTLDGLHGLIFRRDPIIECSDEFKKLGILDNIDRRGTSIYQFSSDTVYDNMQTLWGGYLADYPETGGSINGLEAEQKGIKGYLRYYPAESVINWRYTVINGREQLCLVVLREESDVPIGDEFSHDLSIQYRVLDINNGVYRQRVIYEDGKDEQGKPVLAIKEIPFYVYGEYENEIPFFPIVKNPEKPMLMDMAYANIGHYQKSADYENGVHLTTIPTGYVTGHKPLKDENGNDEIINLGADSFLVFEEEEAKVGTLVFSGAGLTHSETALANAISDMAILGTRLVTPEKGVTESADSAKIHRAGENAVLATYAKNVSSAITLGLKKIAKWEGVDTNISFELCTDYDTLAFDPNALNALANLAEAGKLPMPYVYENLRNGEYASSKSDYEEYATAIMMEQLGYSPLEVYQYVKMKRAGKKPEVQLSEQYHEQNTEEPVDDEESEEE